MCCNGLISFHNLFQVSCKNKLYMVLELKPFECQSDISYFWHLLLLPFNFCSGRKRDRAMGKTRTMHRFVEVLLTSTT